MVHASTPWQLRHLHPGTGRSFGRLHVRIDNDKAVIVGFSYIMVGEMPMAQQFSGDQVTAIVVDAITNSLLLSGRPAPNNITATMKLLKDIEGFDSPMGVDVTVDLELQLGIDLPHNIFVKEVNGVPRARTLNEIVDILRGKLVRKEA